MKRSALLAALLVAAAMPAMAQSPDPRGAEGMSQIKGAIFQVWNQSTLERLPNYEELAVTMRIALDRQGMIVGKPGMIRPAATSDPRFAHAERAAALALMRAQPYDLPADQYARRQVIEVTFNPGLGVLK